MTLRLILTGVLATTFLAGSVVAEDTLAKRALEILDTNCAACHEDGDEGGINFITDLQKLVMNKKAIPGDPETSRIYARMIDEDRPMPPAGESPRPSADEIREVAAWIQRLPPLPVLKPQPTPTPTIPQEQEPAPRSRVSNSAVISAIHAYLSNVPAESDRRMKRFFVLHHLHNMPTPAEAQERGLPKQRSLSGNQLDIVRAAVSKTVNSLSWCPDVVVPKIIDADKCVMVIDLRDYLWEENRRLGRPDLFNILLQDYPYRLTHDQYPDNESAQRKAAEIYEWTGMKFPWIRADWFVATATQPHFYHALLYDAVNKDIRQRDMRQVKHADGKLRFEQPMSADDLYARLEVDLLGAQRRGRVARAGFTRSGVSSQPRLLERVSASYGSLWGSYDFGRGNKTMNLNARPLGPEGVFSAQFSEFSFLHNGGEIIFGLPNGLHGYLLITETGDRIPFGPPDIVEDRAKTLGNGIIVNGLSCIACHDQGLIENFRDEIRFGISGLPQAARRLARKIYLDRPELDELIEKDQTRYRDSLIAAIGPFVSDQRRRAMEEGGALLEPIGPVAKRFLVDTIDLTIMASELNVTEEMLSSAIEFNPRLQRLGLTGIPLGATVNREIWQTGEARSTYQRVAELLRIGSAETFDAGPWRGR